MLSIVALQIFSHVFMANVPGGLWFKILSYTFVWHTLWSQISQPFIVANGGSPALSTRLKLFTAILTDKGRENMAAVFQTTFSNAFSWTKIYKFRLRFHWSLFPRAQLTIPPLVQIMTLRRPGDKPLSEPIMVSLLTHLCVTRPQGVNEYRRRKCHPATPDIEEVLVKSLWTSNGIWYRPFGQHWST